MKMESQGWCAIEFEREKRETPLHGVSFGTVVCVVVELVLCPSSYIILFRSGLKMAARVCEWRATCCSMCICIGQHFVFCIATTHFQELPGKHWKLKTNIIATICSVSTAYFVRLLWAATFCFSMCQSFALYINMPNVRLFWMEYMFNSLDRFQTVPNTCQWCNNAALTTKANRRAEKLEICISKIVKILLERLYMYYFVSHIELAKFSISQTFSARVCKIVKSNVKQPKNKPAI